MAVAVTSLAFSVMNMVSAVNFRSNVVATVPTYRDITRLGLVSTVVLRAVLENQLMRCILFSVVFTLLPPATTVVFGFYLTSLYS